jgi:hypothetical protein
MLNTVYIRDAKKTGGQAGRQASALLLSGEVNDSLLSLAGKSCYEGKRLDFIVMSILSVTCLMYSGCLWKEVHVWHWKIDIGQRNAYRYRTIYK